MPIQQKTKDIIYSWVDESGKTHYSNYKEPLKKTENPINKVLVPANKANENKTAELITQHNSNPFFLIFLLLVMVIVFKLLFNVSKRTQYKKTRNLRPNQEPKIIIATNQKFYFQNISIFQTIQQEHQVNTSEPSRTSESNTIKRIQNNETGNQRQNQEPEVILETTESNFSQDISIESTIEQESQESKTEPSWTLEFIKSLEWREFEKLCAKLMQAKGFHAELGEVGPDGGVDIHIYKLDKPEELYGIAQCKAQRKDIKIDTVRAFRWVMSKKQVNKGLFFTSGKFSKPSQQFCEEEKIEMITGEELLRNLLELPYKGKKEILEEIIKNEYISPTCVNCGIKMVRKTNLSDNGDFWGCVNYPKCRNTLSLRGIDKQIIAN
jgi:restriction endonuclease Mrr